MIVLGLGSNVGDKLLYLRKAYVQLKAHPEIQIIAVSPLYRSDALLPENAERAWHQDYLNAALRIETSLEPLQLLHLIKEIEQTCGRKNSHLRWAPREIDIDILVFGDKILELDNLHIPHPHLFNRPFALWPLADVAPFWRNPLQDLHAFKTAAEIVEQWGSRFSENAPFKTRQIQQRIDMPELVGILNVTPDSFSDGNQFLHPELALTHAMKLVEAGATVIDIGAESTAPQAQAISQEEEWRRLQPILAIIKSSTKNFLLPPKISIDTRHASVAEKALTEFSIDIINDVSGLDDDAMRKVVRDAHCDTIVMHHLCIPERREKVLPRHENPTLAVMDWMHKRLELLEQSGILREKIIFDPGIGFGKMAEQSLQLLKDLALFSKLNLRTLIGHSRKTFLSLFTNQPFFERDIETLAISLHCANHAVDYLRIHHVEMCARAFKVSSALSS